MPAAARPEPEIASAVPAQPQWNSSAEITCIWPSASEAERWIDSSVPKPCFRASRDDLPGNALLFVVLARRRPDHVAGEVPATVLELQLLLIQFEIHRSSQLRRRGRLIDWSVNSS